MQTEKLQLHQQAMLKILEEIDRICRKHHIPYMLFAGSALGAIRHQGFIPWDDDLDVLFLREDYKRFLTAAKAEIDDGVFCLQEEFTSEWPMFFSKLRLNGTTCLEKYHPKFPHHQGVYVDIFPCDNAYESGFLRKFQFYISKIIIAKALDKRGYDTDSAKKKAIMAACRILPLKLLCRICQARGQRESSLVHVFLGGGANYQKSVFPRTWIAEKRDGVFEGGTYPVPTHYDELLTTLYGDYRRIPAEDERSVKEHTILVDLEHSYETYEHYRDNMTFRTFTRSIR